MNYHLSSQSIVSRLKISKQSWVKILSLARFYGWQPMGTRPPSPSLYGPLGLEDEVWGETYLRNDGQTVIAEDALSLAMALEKSLDDIPDFNIEIDRKSDLTEILPFEYFAGDEKHHLVDFIKFCRLGSFMILRI
jgi:hypothetical protein